MNQLAIEMPTPIWIPPSADPRPNPNRIQNCHGACMNEMPTMASMMIAPAIATIAREP